MKWMLTFLRKYIMERCGYCGAPGNYFVGDLCTFCGERETHIWQPLPEAPEGGEE